MIRWTQKRARTPARAAIWAAAVLLAIFLWMPFASAEEAGTSGGEELLGNIEEMLGGLDTQALQDYLDSLTEEQKAFFGGSIIVVIGQLENAAFGYIQRDAARYIQRARIIRSALHFYDRIRFCRGSYRFVYSRSIFCRAFIRRCAVTPDVNNSLISEIRSGKIEIFVIGNVRDVSTVPFCQTVFFHFGYRLLICFFFVRARRKSNASDAQSNCR